MKTLLLKLSKPLKGIIVSLNRIQKSNLNNLRLDSQKTGQAYIAVRKIFQSIKLLTQNLERIKDQSFRRKQNFHYLKFKKFQAISQVYQMNLILPSETLRRRF